MIDFDYCIEKLKIAEYFPFIFFSAYLLVGLYDLKLIIFQDNCAYASITHTLYWAISTRIGDYFDSRVFSPCWTQKEAGLCCSRATPRLFPCYLRVIPVLSHVRPCYLSGHWSQATQNVPYSSILSALTRIKPYCSRVVHMLLPSCSRVAPVFPVLFPSCPVLCRVAPCCTVYRRVNTGYSRVVPGLLRVFPIRGLKRVKI